MRRNANHGQRSNARTRASYPTLAVRSTSSASFNVPSSSSWSCFCITKRAASANASAAESTTRDVDVDVDVTDAALAIDIASAVTAVDDDADGCCAPHWRARAMSPPSSPVVIAFDAASGVSATRAHVLARVAAKLGARVVVAGRDDVDSVTHVVVGASVASSSSSSVFASSRAVRVRAEWLVESAKCDALVDCAAYAVRAAEEEARVRASDVVDLSTDAGDVVDLSVDDGDGWRQVAPARSRVSRGPAPGVGVFGGRCDAPSSPVVLVLCGESGAGKSTLSAKLVATGRWAAANQDTISNGKRGSRQQCIRAAKRALEEGKHVVIDRCGLSVQQREDFVALAKTATPPCALHSIWFNQPISVYAKRAAARVNHPGGVQGEFALRVVQRQHRQKDNAPPTKDEGFVVVRRCKFQDQVDAATVVYKNLPAANISCVFPKPVRSAKKSADEVEDVDEDMVDDGDDDDFGSG